MGQKNSKQGGVDTPRLDKNTKRVILWEVHIARGCLESFNRMLSAHAIVLSLLVTVNLMGFLQPPRGWDGTSGHMYAKSKAVTAFCVANSLSLYTATSGLLFYIYCSHAAIISLQSVPLPNNLANDALMLDLLHNLRAALCYVTLPAMKRRSAYLFFFLACSLIFSMIAYFSAGIASTNPHDRLLRVILPAIPGCLGLLFLLYIAAAKLHLELDFNTRFRSFWTTMARGIEREPIIPNCLDDETIQALDPLPPGLYWPFHRQRTAPVS